ncbi:MAG: hypothetical protein IT379_04330 [Deltaproteobacteria bacterium]|nr:hypothetical protein [Deltaproteobacteria bacterium]
MSRLARAVVISAVVSCVACSPEVDQTVQDSGTNRDVGADPAEAGGTLVLDLIRPDRATTSGGTAFEIFGRGFVDGARVSFVLMGAELDATDVVAEDSTRLTGRTPATDGRFGRASVRVALPTGRTATLPDAFMFVDGLDAGPPDPDMGPPPPPADMGPPPPVDMGPPPMDMGPPPVDVGPPPVDMGPPPPVDMGPPPPMDMGPPDLGPPDLGPPDLGPPDLGPPDLGPPDLGPSDTGPRDTGPVDAGVPRPTVCTVERPVGTDPMAGSFVHGYLAPLGVAPRATRIQLTIPGVSEAPGQSPGVVVEVGRGLLPARGSDDVSGWTWTTASYITDAGSIETYQAAITAPGSAGEYGIAARVTVSGGAPVYCDLDGIANGFSASMTGVIVVRPVGATFPNYCHVQYPLAPPTGPTLTGSPFGMLSSQIYGWVYEPGCTDTGAPGGCPGMAGAVGYGPPGSYPSTERWVWTATTFNVHPVGDPNNDEHWDDALRVVAPAAGNHHVAYRFRIGTGQWLYCDSRDHLGSTNDYHPDGALLMTISP